MNGDKVLVLGDDTRSFLATIRSLGRRGIAIHAAPANFRSPALRSRYIAAIHDLPPWMGDGSGWLTSAEALLCAERFRLVIPCNETSLLPLQRHRERLSQYTQLAIPDDRAIAVLFDKHETREFAKRVGVPVAAGRLATAADTAETVLAELGEPIVAKPRRSYGLQTLAARGKAHVTGDAARLGRLLAESEPGEILLEQFFRGQGVGVSLLAGQGRVLQAFEHHRVHEIAGASFYRVSAPLAPDLLRACEAMVAALGYTGLAMFEFKRNLQGGWILLEVNARPWGSMPLPLALGIDFPYLWYRLLTEGEKRPAMGYRIGFYGRNLLPDLASIAATAPSHGIVAKTWFMTRRIAELSRPLIGCEAHDVLVRDDPRPGLYELAELAAAARKRLTRRLSVGAARRRRHAEAMIVGALRQGIRKPVVLFICQGNICRSPFAERLLRSQLKDASVAIGSAGMMAQPGRPSLAVGIEAAAEHGIDLSDHRSSWLTRWAAEGASLLIVFDDVNYAALFDRYPDLKVPVIRLGDLTALGNIADPVDGDLGEFQRTYARIAAAVAALARCIDYGKDRSRARSVGPIHREFISGKPTR